jgi:hypothetical protein
MTDSSQQHPKMQPDMQANGRLLPGPSTVHCLSEAKSAVVLQQLGSLQGPGLRLLSVKAVLQV